MATSLLEQILNSGTGTSAFNDQRVATSILSKKPSGWGQTDWPHEKVIGQCWAYVGIRNETSDLFAEQIHVYRYKFWCEFYLVGIPSSRHNEDVPMHRQNCRKHGRGSFRRSSTRRHGNQVIC